LVVPVVRFADNKSLAHISSEIKDYGQKAKDKKLTIEDFTGNTFTISNLGMFGIEQFTAIVNRAPAAPHPGGRRGKYGGVPLQSARGGDHRERGIRGQRVSCDGDGGAGDSAGNLSGV
jgi:hypothetical protein